MLMKVHSYCATNGALAEKSIQLRQCISKLDLLLEEQDGGRKAAIKAARDALDSSAEGLPSSPVSSSSGMSLGDDLSESTKLSRRRSSATEKVTISAGKEFVATNNVLDILYFHPQARISDLASQSLDLMDDLVSRGKANVVWPANLSLLNYLDYLSIPTLVYELEYPRTTSYVFFNCLISSGSFYKFYCSIRPLYVIEKTLATFGTFSLLYIVSEHYIIPIAFRDDSFWGAALDLATPFMINYLLLFYISEWLSVGFETG